MKRLAFLLMGIMLAVASKAQTDSLPAFPGAEGGGMYTTGGRGGKVLYVTNLSDDGKKGSFRWAVTRHYPRIVVFAVSGTIELQKKLSIKTDSLTIAGQTAPGAGICIKGYPVKIDADNVIVRYMRFRMGDETMQEADAFEGQFRKNIIIDHCTVSWGTDEQASFYGNENFTFQWSMVVESLNNSVHAKGEHGYGCIWGGKNATFHHNLIANNNSRNPRFDHPGIYKEVANIADHRGNVDFVNNVIYNWYNHASYGGEEGCFNVVNNYYKAGPASKRAQTILQPYATKKADCGKFYVSGNVLHGNDAVKADNMKGIDMGECVGQNPIADKPFEMKGTLSVQSAEDAFVSVVAKAGASLVRDAVDARIAADVLAGTGTITGSVSKRPGIIDTQADAGGWPELAKGEAPVDTDLDGIPDEWEKAHGLNPADKNDASCIAPSGYTWVEEYINSLVK